MFSKTTNPTSFLSNVRPNFPPVQKVYNVSRSSKQWHFESYGECMPPSSGLNFNMTSRSSETLAFALQGLIQNKNKIWQLLCYEISYLTVKCRQLFMDLTVVCWLLSLLWASTSNLSSCFHSFIQWERNTCVVCVHRSFQNLTVTAVTLCIPYQLHQLFIFPTCSTWLREVRCCSLRSLALLNLQQAWR